MPHGLIIGAGGIIIPYILLLLLGRGGGGRFLGLGLDLGSFFLVVVEPVSPLVVVSVIWPSLLAWLLTVVCPSVTSMWQLPSWQSLVMDCGPQTIERGGRGTCK